MENLKKIEKKATLLFVGVFILLAIFFAVSVFGYYERGNIEQVIGAIFNLSTLLVFLSGLSVFFLTQNLFQELKKFSNPENSSDHLKNSIKRQSSEIDEHDLHLKTIIEDSTRRKILFEQAKDGVFILDHNRMLLEANQAFVEILGYTYASEVIGLHAFDWDAIYDTREKLESAWPDLPVKSETFEKQIKRKDGSILNAEVSFNLVVYDDKKYLFNVCRDITTRKYQEEILALEKEIYELNANSGIPFKLVLEKLLLGIERLFQDSSCSILKLDENGFAMPLAGPTLPPGFLESVENLPVGPIGGSSGTAMYRGENILVSDIDRDPLWVPYLDLARKYGWKACWAVPLKKGDGAILGSLSCYFKVIKEPLPIEISLLERAANMVSVLWENNSAADEVRFYNEKYEIVAKATSDTIYDINLLTGEILWNKGIETIFGYENKNRFDLSWRDAKLHPEDKARVQASFQKQVENLILNWRNEYRFLCEDGSYKFIFDKGFLEKDKEGKAVRMIGSMQDITEKKEEEHRLKLLESVITESTDAVIITNAPDKDFHNHQILYVNDAFSKMTGYEKVELIGKSPRMLQGPNSDRNELNRIKTALEKFEPCEIEIINYKKSGEEFWVSLAIAPVANKDGFFTHWIAIERDITDRRKYVSAIEEQNKKLREIAWFQSHVVRAPLARLMGLVSLMEQETLDEKETESILGFITNSAKELDGIIKDIVDKTEQVENYPKL